MSKSLKNFITINDFLKEHTANSLRWFCLMFRYRSYVDYTNDSMNAAVALEARFREFSLNVDNALTRREKRLQNQPESESEVMSRWQDAEASLYSKLRTTRTEVDNALRNDFDTFAAINSLLDLTSATNGYITRGEASRISPDLLLSIKDYVSFVLNSFGVTSLSPEKRATDRCDTIEISEHFKSVMDSVTDFRSDVRNLALTVHKKKKLSGMTQEELVKLYEDLLKKIVTRCDDLRTTLAGRGIKLEDHKDGGSWKIGGV